MKEWLFHHCFLQALCISWLYFYSQTFIRSPFSIQICKYLCVHIFAYLFVFIVACFGLWKNVLRVVYLSLCSSFVWHLDFTFLFDSSIFLYLQKMIFIVSWITCCCFFLFVFVIEAYSYIFYFNFFIFFHFVPTEYHFREKTQFSLLAHYFCYIYSAIRHINLVNTIIVRYILRNINGLISSLVWTILVFF